MTNIPKFYQPYLDHAQGSNLVELFNVQTEKAFKFYENINKKESLFRYQTDKWSIRELLGHICDSEQIFAYRLLRFVRSDKTNLPGFDQDDYVEIADFDNIEWEVLLERFRLIRSYSTMLCNSIGEDQLSMIGHASGFEFTIEELLRIIIGHEMHHRKVIRERYLTKG